MIKYRRQAIIFSIIVMASVFLFSCGLSTPFSFSVVEIGEPSNLPLEDYMTSNTSVLYIKNADETSTVSTLSLRLIYYVETDPDILIAHDESYVGNIKKAWSDIYCDEPIQILADSYKPYILKNNELLIEDNIELDRDYYFTGMELYSDNDEHNDAVINLLPSAQSFSQVSMNIEINAENLPVMKFNNLNLQISSEFQDKDYDQFIYLYGYITAIGTSTPFTSDLFLIGIYKYPATTN